MRINRIAIFTTVALYAALFLRVAVASGDQLTGTWKLNAAKSKYSPGPAPQNLTVTIESDENSYKVIAEGTDRNGKRLHVEYSAKFDGKDYPITGVPNADTVSVKRIDANTVESMQRKGGQLTMTVTTKVSKDGKSRTSTFLGKDANGHAVHNVAVFDRQ
jgi:hypothetical protein